MHAALDINLHILCHNEEDVEEFEEFQTLYTNTNLNIANSGLSSFISHFM